MSKSKIAEWPERFIYVCNTGGAMAPNIIPMLHAGPRRIAGIVILRSISGQDPPTQADETHAIRPAMRIGEYAKRNIGLRSDQIKVRDGHPDEVRPWLHVLEEACDWAAELDIRDVVYNVTGGRKPCTLGALLGLQPKAAGDARVSLISVGLQPMTVRLVELGRDGISENPLPVEAHLRLHDYLVSYGYPEADSLGRAVIERRMLDLAPFAEQLFARAYNLKAMQLLRRQFAALYRSVLHENEQRNRNWQPFVIKNSAGVANERRSDLDNALKLLNDLQVSKALGDVRLLGQGNEITGLGVNSEFAQSYLGGKWLEGLIFARVKALFKGRNDVEIANGVRLILDGTNSAGSPDISDLDIAILRDDRLDIVEVKAVTTARGLHESLTKLAQWRSQLTGQAGRAWLIAPFLDNWQVAKAGLSAHADHVGVRLFCGHKAVGALINELRRPQA